MAFGGQSDAPARESPLARRIAAILAPQWSYSRLYTRAVAFALNLARKVILDVADEIQRDLLENLADLEAGAQLLASENPTAVHQELVTVIVDMKNELAQVMAKHAAKFRPLLDRAENELPMTMGKLDMGVDDDSEALDVDRDRAGATRAGLDEHDRAEEPGRHCVTSDALVVRAVAVDFGDHLMARRPSSRAHQQDDEPLRGRNLIVISDSEEDEDENEADKHLDGNGNVEMNGAAHVPLACTDHNNEREEEVEEERAAERHDVATHLRTLSLSAARPRFSSPATGRVRNKSPSAAHRPKLTRAAVRTALADDEFGSIAFGPGSPFVVTGSLCDYVLLRDVHMHFGQSLVHLDRALLQTVGVYVQDSKEVCRACKKVWRKTDRCCGKWAPPGGGGTGTKKRTLLVGVARRDEFVDDDDDEEEDDGDIGEPRVVEAVVASSPIPARSSRSL
ncbi:hypothetical protein AMAG_17362 [Allomyces macrogynus ATCC 38327]|uniref:Uncharacterized protein n=1 Tax=Allomyces macrogynus (strain ATCC 38327) TaxID=578462 RepID=A0A0L0TF01_ALLM3|nr:hypothetical protein AMAG_17362 [Allomyces macrogynus ATCC 38327]|eukprot:KNE73164.1 hypothetical protein AMAG_17362 [Allomyces macrogynus ATCC 38327]